MNDVEGSRWLETRVKTGRVPDANIGRPGGDILLFSENTADSRGCAKTQLGKMIRPNQEIEYEYMRWIIREWKDHNKPGRPDVKIALLVRGFL